MSWPTALPQLFPTSSTTMSQAGEPRYQYRIPYAVEGPHTQWRVIITTKTHFFFNPELQASHWQLHELQDRYTDLSQNWAEFIGSISFDDIGVLSGVVQGLRFDEYFSAEKEVEDDNKDNNEEGEEDPEEEKAVAFDNETERDAFIGDLLREEGFIETKPKLEELTDKLVSGYSSSEEEEEEEEEDHTLRNVEKEDETNSKINESASETDNSDSEDDSGDNLNSGLDLEITGTEPTASFSDLLSRYKDQISIFDPWTIVQEDLASEFIKHPEYFSLESAQREPVFNEWCLSQRQDTSDSDIADELTVYPTATILYLHLLQDYKKDIKDSFFQVFYNKHVSEINQIQLTKKEKESIYLQFRKMLSDFGEYERGVKKSGKSNPNVNLKKRHLEEFLEANLKVSEIQKSDRAIHTDSNASFFDKWIAQLNQHNLPELIANDCNNFIVADEKRYEIYSKIFSGS